MDEQKLDVVADEGKHGANLFIGIGILVILGLLVGGVAGWSLTYMNANDAYVHLNATIENKTIESCMAGCSSMLSVLHSDDTNVNTQGLLVCWTGCGGK